MSISRRFSDIALFFGLAVSVSLLTTSCGEKRSSAPAEANVEAKSSEVSKKGEVISLTTDDFVERVADFRSSPDKFQFKGTRPAVVDFYATWCGPCKQMAVIFDKSAAKFAGKVDFYRVDIDKESELADFMGIQSIPTILYIPTNGDPQINIGLVEEQEFNSKIMELLK